MTRVTGALEWKDVGSLGRAGKGDKEEGVTICVNDQLDCMGMDEALTQSLWVRIKGAGTGDMTVRVCYRPPNEEH